MTIVGPRVRAGLDLSLRLLAIAVMVGLATVAARGVSEAWDVWDYHLPFAARIAGIVGPDAYVFSSKNAARFAGFPLAMETLQGALWRLTGRPESANLVALASLVGLVIFLRRVHGVPLHVALLALLAIPLVMTHATSSYIDLPASACATMLLLLAFRALARPGSVPLRDVLVATALAVLAANSKFQLIPIVLLAYAIIAVRSAWGPGRRAWLLACGAALPLILATPLKNALLHGNPAYPVALHLLGHPLPFAEAAYQSSPPWLAGAWRPTRFAASILEIGLPSIASGRRWSIDQWTVEGGPAFRMGGFFGAYVVVNLVGLAWALVRDRSREAAAGAAMVGVATLVTAFMPQSHELRYYLFWMLLLVSVNVVLWSRRSPTAAALVSACALAVVVWATGGIYLYRPGESFAALLASKVDRAVIEGAAPGATICVARPPWTFLYAPVFHDKSYRVQEAMREEDCPGASAAEPPPTAPSIAR